MSRESDFLLGTAFSLLTQVRAYMIKNNIVEGVELIENQYQEIVEAIGSNFYSKTMMEK
jgi:hypothetical protein